LTLTAIRTELSNPVGQQTTSGPKAAKALRHLLLGKTLFQASMHVFL
jgi:hypothetical protein